jgi:hypothetical protein
MGGRLASLLLAIFIAACQAAPTVAPSHQAATPSCETPPTIAFGQGGTPVPILLACDKAVAEAFARLPASVGGSFGDDITSIEFHYGRYCPPGWRCGPFFGQGDVGFVVFGLANGDSWLVAVDSDPTGRVSVTDIEPTPTHPPVIPNGT